MNICQPSKIIEDIVALETDFKHNLSLLKIRESEIDRCTKTNESLQEALDSTLLEVHRLNMKYAHLRGDFQRFESCSLSEAEHYRRRIDLLEQQLNQCVENELRVQREYKENLRSQEEQLTGYYQKQMESQKKIYERINLDIHKQYDREHKIAQNMQNALDEIINKNLELQNRIRNLESQSISDGCFYKSEQELNKSRIADMQVEIKELKLENASLKEEAEELEKYNQALKEDFAGQDNYLDSLKIENEHLTVINEQLTEKLKELTKANNELDNTMKHFISDIKLSKKTSDELVEKPSSEVCSIPAHFSFETVLKQNKILQEVIKETKRSKENLQQENTELCEAAKKIEKLEALVEHLKQIIISNRRLPVEVTSSRCSSILTENNVA